MSNDVIPHRPHPLGLRERQALGEVRDARRPARRAAARLDAAAIVAGVGLRNVEILTATEVALCKRQGAVADERARAIVDAYAQLAANELLGLSLGGGCR